MLITKKVSLNLKQTLDYYRNAKAYIADHFDSGNSWKADDICVYFAESNRFAKELNRDFGLGIILYTNSMTGLPY